MHLLKVHFIVLWINYSFVISIPCTTPNSEQAECILLLSCPILQNALLNGDSSAKKFVEASKCRGDFSVCCGTHGNWTKPEVKKNKPKTIQEIAATHETRREYVVKKLLPGSSYCGLQHSDDHFNYGNETALDEFPWVVHIPYHSHYLHPTPGSEFKCAGVLLSNKFVLTTLSCASDGFLNSVNIGQHHKHRNVSCSEDSDLTECTEPVITVSGLAKADIPNTGFLLLKLSTDILYSDYVRPICMPLNELHMPKVGASVYSSGWGEEDIKGKNIMIKKKIVHEIVNSSLCNEGNSTDRICFVTKNSTHHICHGDEGGPLMYSYRNQWFLSGLIDFEDSLHPCIKNRIAIAKNITSDALEKIIDFMFYLGHK